MTTIHLYRFEYSKYTHKDQKERFAVRSSVCFLFFLLSHMFLCLPVLPLLAGEKTIIGGLALKTLKKLNGAKLSFPSASTVEANAMGLGPTDPNK